MSHLELNAVEEAFTAAIIELIHAGHDFSELDPASIQQAIQSALADVSSERFHPPSIVWEPAVELVLSAGDNLAQGFPEAEEIAFRAGFDSALQELFYAPVQDVLCSVKTLVRLAKNGYETVLIRDCYRYFDHVSITGFCLSPLQARILVDKIIKGEWCSGSRIVFLVQDTHGSMPYAVVVSRAFDGAFRVERFKISDVLQHGHPVHFIFKA